MSGLVGWDEGIFVGTGTILNVTSPYAALSISGTVLNLNIPNPSLPAGPSGLVGWDEGIPLGTGTVLKVVSQNAALSISGTVLNLHVVALKIVMDPVAVDPPVPVLTVDGDDYVYYEV